MRTLLSRSLAGAVTGLLWLAVMMAPASGFNFGHIKNNEFIFTATEADLPWIAAHYDWVGLEDKDLVQPFRALSSAPVFVYALYHSVQGIENEWATTDYVWLRAWCAANGKNWEDMFVHFSQDTVHRPGNDSASVDTSQDQRFDTVFVYNGSSYADKTTDAYSVGGASFAIGATSDWILYVGYDEPFKEANFTLSTPASANWAGTWEYWNGSTWAALSPTDGTADMTQSGKVEKAPPPMATWARCAVNNVTRWWWRLRTTAAGATQPVVAGGGLTGRNYITFSGGAYHQPGWASANDVDSDGYAEDLTKVPTATARFRYEARACYYELTRYYLNMGAANCRAGVVALALSRVTENLGGGYHYDSIFFDNGHPTIIFDNLVSGGTTIEDTSTAAWVANGIATLGAVKAAVGPGVIVFVGTGANTDAGTESFIDAVDGCHAEGIINAASWHPRERFDAVMRRDAKGKWDQVYARKTAPAGDWERGKMGALALYYMASGDHTYYMWGLDSYAEGRFIDNWYNARAYNVGAPKAPYYILHQEKDPSSAVGIAYMYARDFDNAFVVAVPLPDWDSNYTASYTAALPAYAIPGGGTSNRYQKLNSDGTINPTILMAVMLRNAEGVVLVKSDLDPPAVTVTKGATPSQLRPGETITYTITYHNDSSAVIQNVVLTDPIPQSTTYVANSTKLNGTTVSPDPFAGGQITVPIGSVAAGGSGTVVLQAKVN